MKKIVLLSVVLILSTAFITGCGSTNDKSGTTQENETTQEYEITTEYNKKRHTIVKYNGEGSVVTVPNYCDVELICQNPEQIKKIVLSDETEKFIIKNEEEYTHLSEYEVAKSNSKYASIEGALFYKSDQGLWLEKIPPTKTEYVVSEQIYGVKIRAFDYWQGTEFTVPESVERLYYDTSYGEINLDHKITINIPEALLHPYDDLKNNKIESINNIIKEDSLILKCNGEIIDTLLEIDTEADSDTTTTTTTITTTTSNNSKNSSAVSPEDEKRVKDALMLTEFPTSNTTISMLKALNETFKKYDLNITLSNSDSSCGYYQYYVTAYGDYFANTNAKTLGSTIKGEIHFDILYVMNERQTCIVSVDDTWGDVYNAIVNIIFGK